MRQIVSDRMTGPILDFQNASLRRSVLCVVACAVVACSSGSGPGAPLTSLYQSGTRLRARVTEPGTARGGSRLVRPELASPCTFLSRRMGSGDACQRRSIVYPPPQYLEPAAPFLSRTMSIPRRRRRSLPRSGPRVPSQPAGCGADLVAAGTYDEYIVDAWRVGPEQSNAGALFDRDDSGACIQSLVSSGPVHPLEPISAAQLVGETVTSSNARPVDGGRNHERPTMVRRGSVGRSTPRSGGPVSRAGCTGHRRLSLLCPTARPAPATPQGCGTGAVAACANEICIGGVVVRAFVQQPGRRALWLLEWYRNPVLRARRAFDPQRFPSLTSDLVGTGRLRLEITASIGR